MAGRKSKLTPELQRRLIEALRVGNTRKASAQAAGTSETRFYEWMAEGEKEGGRSVYREFREAVLRAEAECEVQNVAILKQAAAGWETRTVRTKTKSYSEVLRDAAGFAIPGKDGGLITKEITETETVEIVGREFDWRAALEWLKRRKREDWGDNVAIDVDRQIEDLVAELAGEGQDAPAGQASE